MKSATMAFLLAILAMFTATGQIRAQDIAQIHNDLRALKDRTLEAVNKSDGEALIKELGRDIWFTAMNNETFHGVEQGRAYYERMMAGGNSIVESMSVTAEPDDLAVLYANNTMAVSTGTSTAHFKLRAGLAFDVPLRWTATLSNDGTRWTIAAIHFSSNMFDNPILSNLKRFAMWLAAGLAVAGLVVGFFLGRYRRKAVAA